MSEQQLRMRAYYYGFQLTGEPEIDLILSAVASAGKSFHHTDQWNEEVSPEEPHTGNSPVDWIRNAAALAAQISKQAKIENDQLRAQVAGLKTGYEAYERVNAELRAEVEGLRRDKSEPCDGCFMADAEVLRKDAGRYRWLRRAGNTKAIALVAEHCLDALDEAIDAALGQGEQS
ncbi:hypothetical protein [Pseudomonas sp. PSPC3-3]|uniref:hypothetical protein n=1 Tax=unclassified Pseudomonas TaxID=196821 RepID=UPI003CE6F346